MYVDLALKMGYSQHVAFAINAADWGIKANSFQAAVKKVERYWRRLKSESFDTPSGEEV